MLKVVSKSSNYSPSIKAITKYFITDFTIYLEKYLLVFLLEEKYKT